MEMFKIENILEPKRYIEHLISLQTIAQILIWAKPTRQNIYITTTKRKRERKTIRRKEKPRERDKKEYKNRRNT